MSDLNTLIQSWRAAFSDLSNTQLDELEDHLHKQIESLQPLGLSEREAFTIAAMRCGKPAQLSYEYAQSDSAAAWSGRVRWMIVGFLVCTVGNGKLALISTLIGGVLLTRGVSTPLSIAIQMLTLSGVIAVAVMFWQLWLRHRPRLVEIQPPRWLTSGWSLAILVAVVPWMLAAASTLGMMALGRMLSVNQLGQLTLSSHVTWMVLPFTMPLILLIVAISLARHRAPMRPMADLAI